LFLQSPTQFTRHGIAACVSLETADAAILHGRVDDVSHMVWRSRAVVAGNLVDYRGRPRLISR
jgi:hypothetical protein